MSGSRLPCLLHPARLHSEAVLLRLEPQKVRETGFAEETADAERSSRLWRQGDRIRRMNRDISDVRVLGYATPHLKAEHFLPPNATERQGKNSQKR